MKKGEKNMYDNVFRRVEQKYLINKYQLDELLNRISTNIEEDIYFKSEISNIYFDNDNHELLIESLEKPDFKIKIRLRMYNKSNEVFLEIKDKVNGIVGKRRIKLTLEEFNNYLDNNKIKDTQIMKELDYYFKLFKLKPSIFVAYDRLSYKDKDNQNLRITIDGNLRSRYNDLNLEKGSYGEKFFSSDMYIMEIKVLDAMPIWLARNLSELKIFPTSFSKVGSIYIKNKGSEVLC